MALQFSVQVRSAMADAIESAAGTAPTLELRTGTVPATPATADSGTVVATMTLPSDWLTNPATGAKALSGTWQDLSADATGTAGHFRIKQGATTHIQGSVTGTGGGGDLTLDNPALVATQQVSITAFNLLIANP